MSDARLDAETMTAAAGELFRTPFGAVLRLVSETDAEIVSVTVDGSLDPPVAAAGAKGPADCVWRGRPDAMRRVLSGARGLIPAFISGRIEIAGDMSVMARLELGEARS